MHLLTVQLVCGDCVFSLLCLGVDGEFIQIEIEGEFHSSLFMVEQTDPLPPINECNYVVRSEDLILRLHEAQ